jgi:phosphoribosylanthranilate isomerase
MGGEIEGSIPSARIEDARRPPSKLAQLRQVRTQDHRSFGKDASGPTIHEPGDRQIGGLGRTHDWSISRRIVDEVGVPVILAGGLDADNVVAAIAAVRPAGVDSKTKTDRADGNGKDLDKVRRFVTAAKLTTSTR